MCSKSQFSYLNLKHLQAIGKLILNHNVLTKVQILAVLGSLEAIATLTHPTLFLTIL